MRGNESSRLYPPLFNGGKRNAGSTGSTASEKASSWQQKGGEEWLMFWTTTPDSLPFISNPPLFGGHFVGERETASKRVQLVCSGQRRETLKEPLCR